MVNKKGGDSKPKKRKVRKSIGDALKVAIAAKVNTKASIASSRSTNSLLGNSKYSSSIITKSTKPK